MAMKAHHNNKAKSFEAALNRLEEIVSEMERGDLSLDAILKKFEEGMKLAQFCSKKLEEAERKIEALVKKDNGSLDTREFLPSAEDAPNNKSSKDGMSRRQQPSDQQSQQDQEPLF